jgi:hypothetical protein
VTFDNEAPRHVIRRKPSAPNIGARSKSESDRDNATAITFLTMKPVLAISRTSSNAVNIGLFLYRRGKAPFDHQDLNCIIYCQARDHYIGENPKRLPPRQWHEPRKAHACQERAYECIRHKGSNECLAGHRRKSRANASMDLARARYRPRMRTIAAKASQIRSNRRDDWPSV